MKLKMKPNNFQKQYKAFVEGYRSPSGPLRYLPDEEKKKINFIINEKLEELEATGLTREEILYDHPTVSIILALRGCL